MRRVIFRCVFLALCGIAALMPIVPISDRGTTRPATPFPGWPEEFESRALFEIPLSAREAEFNAGFPGRVAKFTDGRRQFILRWVTAGTRKLHSSTDCFRGLGYAVTPQPLLRDEKNLRWSCFRATRGTHELTVRERITDGSGHEWTDVSAWFWSVFLRRTTGPWTAVTVIEEAPSRSVAEK